MRLLVALLAVLLPALAVAAPGQTDGLPQPGECALWAGQARLLARRLLDRAVQTDRPELARFYVETAYQLSPAAPLLYNLGVLSLRGGQTIEAADLLLRYADELGGEVPAEHKSAVEKGRQSLALPHHAVRLKTTPGAFVFVDDRVVGQAPLRTPLQLAPGPHRLRIEHGYRQLETRLAGPPANESTDEVTMLALPLPQALVVLSPELFASQQKRLGAILSENGFTLVPTRDRELLLKQLADRTGCLTQTGCQIWLGEQLDVEQVLVVRSIDLRSGPESSTAQRVSRLSLEVLTVPQGSQLFHREALCPDCNPVRSEPYLQALVRTLRRELPDLIGPSAAGDEPAPVGFVETPPARLSPCALARGTARRLARRLLSDASSLDGLSEARVRLETAYQLSPSPLLLYNLGQLYRRQGQLAVAADLLGRFLATAEDELTSERRSKAETALSEWTGASAQLDLRGPAGAMVIVDGRLHGSLPLQTPLVLTPGSHTVVLESGYRTTEQTVKLRSTENRLLTMTIPEATLLLPDESAMSSTPLLLTVARRAAEESGRIVIPDRDRELLLQSAPDYGNCDGSLLCMRRVGRMLGAQSVISLKRISPGRWAGRLLDTEDSALTSATSEDCTGCDTDDRAIRRVVQKLLDRQHSPRGEAQVDTQSGATLWMDGFELGSAPQKLRLVEGNYKLEARLSPTRRLAATLRVPIDTSLTLRFVDPPRLRSRTRLVIGTTLLAAGAALIGVGIGVWADASRPPPPHEGVDARPPGFIAGPVLLVGGATSAIAGGLMVGLRSR